MSVTLSGLLVTILSLVFTPEEANTFIEFIDKFILVIGILLTYWGRYRQGDLTWYGKKV